jgi:hypothetical protein
MLWLPNSARTQITMSCGPIVTVIVSRSPTIPPNRPNRFTSIHRHLSYSGTKNGRLEILRCIPHKILNDTHMLPGTLSTPPQTA